MGKFFRVKNFAKWQHYKKRNPPWIKLHREIFNDYKFTRLPDEKKAHLMQIWLLASQMGNVVPYDNEWISNKISATVKVKLEDFEEGGFIEETAPC